MVMAVFVLVHGAWGGAHGFRKVRGPLRQAGHEVFTPSLTGIGERAHPLEDYPFTRTYIKATGEPRPANGGPFWAAADRAVASPAWRYREIATNHMIASNRPGDLVRLLLELV